MRSAVNVKLKARDEDLDELSFCRADVPAINQWALELPLADTNETATQLEVAITELARLRTDAAAKFEFLETVRPLMHYICTRLDRNHSEQNPTYERTGYMQARLCDGYKSVVLHHIEQAGGDKDILANALHRLISDLSRSLLHSLQRYVPAPKDLWLDLNQSFSLAEQLELSDHRLADTENHAQQDASIADAYIRALLLATCKPNQLAPHQLTTVFNALEPWAGQVMLDQGTHDALFVVDLEQDGPPNFQPLVGNPADGRALRTEVLAYELEAYLKEVDTSVSIPEAFPQDLLAHLIEAWSVMKPRAFTRLPAKGMIRVCVGLRAVHYFLSGGIEFTNQLSNTDALLRREVNPFLDVQYESDQSAEDDVWSQAHDLKVRIPINPNVADPDKILLQQRQQADAETSAERPFDHFETLSIDTSPGGYCIEWVDTIPSNAQVGELVALREERDQRWCVAIIRWIKQTGKAPQMGVELIAPRAIPVAIRVIKKKGGPTDYARALLLPELAAINQPASMITPRVPFERGQKINIQRQGIQSTGQLLEALLITESVRQFTFRMLDGYLENTRESRTMGALSAMTREDTTLGS